MRGFDLTIRQLRFENRAFWRNPAAAVFTMFFPLLFLVIFNVVFGSQDTAHFGRPISASTFYVPAIAAFSIINASYTNLAITLAMSRDHGILKRKRGTPLPPSAFLGARILHSVFVGLLLVAIVVVAGVLFYEVDLPQGTWPAFIVAIFVGSTAFAALGIAITAAIPNGDAAPAVTGITVWPLLFISGVFFPDIPGWLADFASIFPIKPFLDATLAAFNPFSEGNAFRWGDIAVVAAWGVAGFVAALRYFSWEPRR